MSFNQMGPTLSCISPSTGPKTLTTDRVHPDSEDEKWTPGILLHKRREYGKCVMAPSLT